MCWCRSFGIFGFGSLRYQTRIEAEEKNEGILLKSAARNHEVQRVWFRDQLLMWSVYCAVSHVNEVIEYSSDSVSTRRK